ncbi:MAG: hypothetical protein JST80_00245 [Bdellovibrionales bacterium]|nr:hypothetical protein [Bdellovibrionales bacterium]
MNRTVLRGHHVTLLSLYLTLLIGGCAIHKPCSEGGDITWNPKITGDKRCEQKEFSGHKMLNHGKFTQAYKTTGTIALEGQFDEGRKEGLWLYYGEDTKLRSVKYFDRGVEKTPPASAQKQIDLIIRQKAGMK